MQRSRSSGGNYKLAGIGDRPFCSRLEQTHDATFSSGIKIDGGFLRRLVNSLRRYSGPLKHLASIVECGFSIMTGLRRYQNRGSLVNVTKPSGEDVHLVAIKYFADTGRVR